MKANAIFLIISVIGLFSLNVSLAQYTTSYSNNNDNRLGKENTFLGYLAGFSNSIGMSNVCIGAKSGSNEEKNIYFMGNVLIGSNSGSKLTSGFGNTFLGYQTGINSSKGSGNVFIGYEAGINEEGSNKLYISNSGTSNPLLYGDFKQKHIRINGSLDVDSILRCEEIYVTDIAANTMNIHGLLHTHDIIIKNVAADYVFENEYTLPTLYEVDNFIKENKHLPGIPPAEITQQGISVSEMNTLLLEKVEELTLYIIHLQKEIDELKVDISQ